MGYEQHKEESGARRVNCAVITVSDTRTEETDTSGQIIKEQMTANGHKIMAYRIVKDEPPQIRALLQELGANPDCHAVIFNGGTGIAKRDTTFDVVDSMLEKRLQGFGEIFRYLSYQDIGSGAIMSRATAGVYRDTIVVLTPGSSGAVKLAMEKLILPEISHLVWEVARQA